MKHTFKYILLDAPIIVSTEIPQEGDMIYNKVHGVGALFIKEGKSFFRKINDNGKVVTILRSDLDNDCRKIIAGLPGLLQIYNGLADLDSRARDLAKRIVDRNTNSALDSDYRKNLEKYVRLGLYESRETLKEKFILSLDELKSFAKIFFELHRTNDFDDEELDTYFERIFNNNVKKMREPQEFDVEIKISYTSNQLRTWCKLELDKFKDTNALSEEDVERIDELKSMHDNASIPVVKITKLENNDC